MASTTDITEALESLAGDVHAVKWEAPDASWEFRNGAHDAEYVRMSAIRMASAGVVFTVEAKRDGETILKVDVSGVPSMSLGETVTDNITSLLQALRYEAI